MGGTAGEEHVEDLREGLRDQVVRVGPGDQLPREARRCVTVAGEQVAVRGHVTAANARDQLGVAQLPVPGGHLVDNGHVSR